MKCKDCPYFDEVERQCVRTDGRCVEDDQSEDMQHENDARYVESVIKQEGEKMKYLVRIQEVLEKEVIVEAESDFDAMEKADDLYHKGEIVLTADDYEGVDFFLGRPITPDMEEQIQEEINNNLIDERIYR